MIQHPFDAGIKFVPALHYTWEPDGKRCVTLIEAHSMEAPNKPTTAESVAAWFAGKLSPIASPHVCADMNSLVACVLPKDVAWACGPANWCGYSIEFAGYAKQLRGDWLHPDNLAMLAIGALHLAKACGYFRIPARALDDEDVALCFRDSLIRQGKIHGADSGHPGGVTTHVQCNRVWRNHAEYGLPAPSGDISHTDPGNLPVDVLVDLMKPASGTPTPLPPPPRLPSGVSLEAALGDIEETEPERLT